MAYITGNVPYFRCLVRRQYTRNLVDSHGDYIPAVAYGVRCIRGDSLWFQCMLLEPFGGCSFMLPIESLVWKACAVPPDLTYVQPWDCFSSDFGVCEFSFLRRGAVQVLPERMPGQYRFSLDFTGSDLADDPEQHKHLHVCFLDGGLIGAFPNNRLIWEDPAFWQVTETKPDFQSLAPEFRSEGNQRMMRG